MKTTNKVWQDKLEEILFDYQYESSPRGMKVKEVINGTYTVPMPAYISLKSRKVNKSFMFAEAAWIILGSNRLEDIQPYMDMYKNFSDDRVFLKGAYGPKVVDQLPYVVDALVNDNDSRQAVLTTWRERPGPSKDIPCTVSMQFLIRDDVLHSVVTMRSNDIVLGFTYDVFTFSMVAKSVQLLLRDRGILCDLGDLSVNAGSLHLYEPHWDISKWTNSSDIDQSLIDDVDSLNEIKTYSELILKLKELANQ